MGKSSFKAAKPLILLFTTLLLAAGCSEDTTQRERTREFVEGTLSLPEAPETTGGVTNAGSTVGSTDATQPDVLLRLEGDPEVRFSGICTAGTEDNVISGQVPARYRFDLNGQNLSCRVQKRSPGNGSLRVVLLAGDSTRSVQQTEARDNVLNISYTGE